MGALETNLDYIYPDQTCTRTELVTCCAICWAIGV